MVWYVDTSAFLKLVVVERESDAMRTWFSNHGPCWSSRLLQTEAIRAAVTLGLDPEVVLDQINTLSLVMPGQATFLAAARLVPKALRSLDALHLATALELGQDLEAVVTYDARMIGGARAAGLPVLSPA